MSYQHLIGPLETIPPLLFWETPYRYVLRHEARANAKDNISGFGGFSYLIDWICNNAIAKNFQLRMRQKPVCRPDSAGPPQGSHSTSWESCWIPIMPQDIPVWWFSEKKWRTGGGISSGPRKCWYGIPSHFQPWTNLGVQSLPLPDKATCRISYRIHTNKTKEKGRRKRDGWWKVKKGTEGKGHSFIPVLFYQFPPWRWRWTAYRCTRMREWL